ncbi:MAG: hypothetical protein B7Y41_13700 [Hydrogenophilales bacterium 28-61-23]|nr:MAG: hypothetical protein B7Y41_13700 [Hydrogenophilales bacterium 28-61-23]
MQNFGSDRRQPARAGGLFVGLLALVAVLGMQGCATHSEGFRSIEQQAAIRNIPGAIKALDQFHATDLAKTDETLKYLNRGMLLRLQADYSKSNTEFDTAKSLIDKLEAISVAEQAGSALINEGVKAYTGDANEQLLLYGFKALNYLQLNDFDAAAVEARQFDIKQRLITEKYPEAKFISGAFVRYLNGMIYEAVGEPDSARIEFTKALEGYQSQSKFTNCGAPSALRADLARVEGKTPSRSKSSKRSRSKADSTPDATAALAEANGEVVFFLHNGLGPSLAENLIQVPNPVPGQGTSLLRIALPKFVERPLPVMRFELSSGGQSTNSEVAEDVNGLAKKSLEARLPGIQTRALVRLVAKNKLTADAKKRSEQAAKQNTGDLASMLRMSMGTIMDITATLTERADTRSWSLLPGNIQLARLALPPGTHDLKVSYYGVNGNLLSTREFKGVRVDAARKTFLSDYYL